MSAPTQPLTACSVCELGFDLVAWPSCLDAEGRCYLCTFHLPTEKARPGVQHRLLVSRIQTGLGGELFRWAIEELPRGADLLDPPECRRLAWSTERVQALVFERVVVARNALGLEPAGSPRGVVVAIGVLARTCEGSDGR